MISKWKLVFKGMEKLQEILLPLLLLSMTVINPPPCVQSECKQYIVQSGVFSAGNITSPGWPAPYPPDAHCQYRLQGENWQGIKITFLQFDLEPRYSAGCLNDYLEINTVDVKGQRSFIGRFCGMEVPAPILVLHPTMEIDFRSNHAVHSNGFMATFEFVDEKYVTTPKLNATSPCGNVIKGEGGIITSPGYPRGYAAGLDCMWLVRVKYSHSIYLRVQHLEFQGSTANCQKAQLRIYDGYEHSLAEPTVLKRFCGDTRFYKGEDEKLLLSSRNRLLIRFTTTEPSKPVNDSDASVGFQLVWSDVEFDTAGNCTSRSRFPCKEAQICFTHHHKGGTSSCPDLRHYCIAKELVCDGTPHCGEIDSSDERNCYQIPIMVTMVGAPMAVLSCGLCLCFCCFMRQSRRREERRRRNKRRSTSNAPAVNSVADTNSQGITNTGGGSKGGGCCDCCCISSSESSNDVNGHHRQHMNQHSQTQRKEDLVGKHLACHQVGLNGKGGDGDDASFIHQNSNAPMQRGPIYFKNELESPGASDIVSPASGFSDSESDIGSQIPMYCPAHGPIPMIPMRYLNRHHFPMLPAVQEQTYQSDTYDEGGSTYSSGQNSDQIIQVIPCSQSNSMLHPPNPSDQISNAAGMVNEWRMRRGVQRSDAIYISDDGKSSIASSPGRICPRCMEKEQREISRPMDHHGGKMTLSVMDEREEGSINNLDGQGGGVNNQGMQFDSGIIDCSIAGDPCGGGGMGGGGGGGGTGVGGNNPVKNVSFETCTSSDSAISTKGSRSVSWNKPCTTTILPSGAGRMKQNVIEEVVTSQTNSNSSVSTSTSQQCNILLGGGGGGTNQGIQTDLPSPPPSTISQDDNNTLMEDMEEDLPPCMSREGNNNCATMGVGGGGGGGSRPSSTFCVTVTTFGVNPSGGQNAVPTMAKATDV